MNEKLITNHRFENRLHTLLLIAGMLGLVTLLGYLLGGTTGLVWAIVFGLGILFFGGSTAPRFLLRMLNARMLHPEEAPQLYEIVRYLARRAGLARTPRIYFVRQPVLNAFALGSRAEPALGVTDGLLRHLDARDLTGILAHEISHIRHNDLRVMSLAAVLSQITRMFSFFGQILLIVNLPLLMFGRSPISWLAILLLLGAPTISTLLQLALSRTREFDADLGAAGLTGDPEGLAVALRKLETLQNRQFWGLPHRMVPRSTTFSTHPPTEERVARLMQIAGRNRFSSSTGCSHELSRPAVTRFTSRP